MNRFYFIAVVSIVLFATGAKAQVAHGGVVIHSDPRLGMLMKKSYAEAAVPKPHKIVSSASAPAADKPARADKPVNTYVAMKPENRPPQQLAGHIYYTTARRSASVSSGKGFRVQIYNGPDRNKAIDIKNEFMRRNPGVRTYLSYVSPCFRVKVGNYRRRSDAEGMYREARSTYTPCMIVPDIITISTF